MASGHNPKRWNPHEERSTDRYETDNYSRCMSQDRGQKKGQRINSHFQGEGQQCRENRNRRNNRNQDLDLNDDYGDNISQSHLNRGQNYVYQTGRKYEEHQNIRGQHIGPPDNLRPNSDYEYRRDDQFESYPWQFRGTGRIQNMSNPIPNYGLLPDTYNDSNSMLSPHRIQTDAQPVHIRQPMYDYGQPEVHVKPLPLMSCHLLPSRQVINADQRDQHRLHFDERSDKEMMGSIERSQRGRGHGNGNGSIRKFQNIENSNEQRGHYPTNERGYRGGRERGRHFRGNRNTLNDRNKISGYSEQSSFCFVSDEDNAHKDQVSHHKFTKGRGPSNRRGNVGRGYRTLHNTVKQDGLDNNLEVKTGDRNEQETEAKVQERVKCGNDSDANGPDVNQVFKYMVKILRGKGTPEAIKSDSGFFSFEFDEKSWFRKLKTRFTVIERQGVIEFVLVYNRNATFCIDYITKRSCNKANCKRYHVCKDFLAGNCVSGDGCNLSHNLLDERNIIVSKRLGYSNVFSSEEIRYILQARYPHICNSWIDNNFCKEPLCIGLHLCPRYVIGQCLEGENCQLVHDKSSNHNKPILDAYGMSKWDEDMFKERVYMKRKPKCETRKKESERNHERRSLLSDLGESASSVGNINNSKKTQELENSASERVICDKYIIGKCQSQRCEFLHCTILSPYLWQVNLYGQWLHLDDFEEIEKAYCENKELSNEIHLTFNGIEFSVVIVFRPVIRAVAVVIVTQDGGIQTKARRLSTMSYKQDDDGTNNFRTQWRWYWRGDFQQQWKLFDQDVMQHTLEVKFLAKQKEFNYWKENCQFKYVIDFEDMKQKKIDTREVQEITRRPIFVSQKNVEEKQFPACLSAAPLVETPLPDKWVPWDLAHPFELVTIEKDSEIYTWVSDCFFKTLSRTEIEIDSIFRMQNHMLWSFYYNKKKFMHENLKRLGEKEHIDQRYLFHGTDSFNVVRYISAKNLDNRVSGKNSTRYGDGTFFERDARDSHEDTGTGLDRFMFMVTVLVGDYTLGNRRYRRPPNKPGNDHELYDSCVNDEDNPSIFIVFDKNQYYPEYLIQYHKLNGDAVEKTSKPTADYGHGSVGGKSAAAYNYGSIDGNSAKTYP